MRCRNCKLKKLKRIVKIGKQPLSGIFYKKKRFNLKKYSLDLFKCRKCDLVQLLQTPDKKKLFGESYEYKTSLSNLMILHLKKKINFLKKKKYLNDNSCILDIGSNDGTFLNQIKRNNKLYGIDPSAKKFKNLYKKKINIINNFFSKKNVIAGSYKSIKFDLISSFAMFYDVNEPNLFCQDIFSLLKKNGVWILELSYFPLLLKNLTYDQICHEHATYYTLTVFNNIIKKNKLKIIDATLNEINGGSIEIICSKNSSNLKPNTKNIKKILSDERKINNKSYENFNKRIDDTKNLINMFVELNSKKKILGYGASTKGNIVLNHCKIKDDKIKFICDGSKRKRSLYTPGSNIKIISKQEMRKINPDYLLVLIWSFRKEVIQQEIDFLKKGGKLVFHLPRFHIVNIDNFKNYLKSDFKELSYEY